MDYIETEILKNLSIGLSQTDISNQLKKKGITPNSVSMIEKKIREIKKTYKAKNLFHLAIILKNKNLI